MNIRNCKPADGNQRQFMADAVSGGSRHVADDSETSVRNRTVGTMPKNPNNPAGDLRRTVDADRRTVDDEGMTSQAEQSVTTPIRDSDEVAPRRRSAFPPIDDYAFLSDCETNCLVARNGAVEWMCVPRPDSPSVFGAILDRSAGHFRIGPYGADACRPRGATCRAALIARDHLADPRPAG